jgi:hypothetical protein
MGCTKSRGSWRTLSPLVVAMAAGLLGVPTAEAQVAVEPVAFDPLHGGLPYFDARLDHMERATPRVRAAVEQARKKDGAAREAELARLKSTVYMLAVDESELYGTPYFVRSTYDFLTEKRAVDAKVVVSDYVRAWPAVFEISPAELRQARMKRDYYTRHNGVRHLTYQQQHAGVDIFECEVRANVMPDGRLINISSTMLPRPEGGFVVPEFRLSDAEAVAAAAKACRVELTGPIWPKGSAEGPTHKRAWDHTGDFRPDEEVVTERVYFAVTRDDIRSAWKVVVPVHGIGHTYDVIVDAQDGSLLWRANRLCFGTTQPITMRVYTSGSPAPGHPGTPTQNGFQFPFVERQLVTITPEMMAPYSPNGWINDNESETLGNNVDAHADHDGNNSPDLPRPNGGPSRVFDFPLDVMASPQTYKDAAVVQMFYYCNMYHDQFYAMGFDEAAGNYQQINFTGQGVGNDRIQADVQDRYLPPSGTPSSNNANFTTSGTDGSTGRCQMYVFIGPEPDRDGTLDADIVYHELTHGTSIRLHGGLTGVQPQSMGEGWGDFVAIASFAEPDDDFEGVFATGGYATYQFSFFAPVGSWNFNYYSGIRRFPYSVDFSKNPQTYADIDPAQQSYPPDVPRNTSISNTANEVHNAGEVWCNTLIECRAALMRHHGFEGNQRMLQLVVDGMKLSPGNPNMLVARDAILQADMVNYGGEDMAQLWHGFARRGMGLSATSPAVSASGVHEAFDVPQFVTFAFPDGLPSQLSPTTATSFQVDMSPTNLTLTPDTAQVFYSVNGGEFTPAAMTAIDEDSFLATIPALPCFSEVRYYLSVGTSGGTWTHPSNAPGLTHQAEVYSTQITMVSDSFETATPGWTSVGGTSSSAPPLATTGVWERTTPQETAAQPGGGHTGSFCWVTDGRAGANVGTWDIDNGQVILTSPAFDLSGVENPVVEYWRWYNNAPPGGNNPFTNTFLIDISSDNGATWTRAETIGPAGAEVVGGWRRARWDLASRNVTPTSQVRLRFTAQDTTGAIVEAAIDDLAIYSRTCSAGPVCGTSDFDGDGDAGTDADIEAFFACLAGNCCPTCFPGGPDFDGDGDAGTDADIEAFFRVLGGGNC